jgi:hypothetical protein
MKSAMIGLLLIVFSFCLVSASFSEGVNFGAKLRLYAVESKKNNTSRYGLSKGLVLAARAWEYYGAYATADKANKEFKSKYGVGFMLRNYLPVLALNYSF